MRPILVALSVLVAAPLYGQLSEITPFVGFQSGGSLLVNDLNTPLSATPAFGLTLTWDWARNSKFDVMVSHQNTHATRNDPLEPSVTVDATLNYFDIGGRYVFDPVNHATGYIAMTVGLTRLAVEGGQAIAFNFAGGGGVDLRLSKRTALRLDGRWHATLANSGGSIGCSSIGGVGTCTGFSSGSLFGQFTGTAGLVYHF
jgi:hypothetical protein